MLEQQQQRADLLPSGPGQALAPTGAAREQTEPVAAAGPNRAQLDSSQHIWVGSSGSGSGSQRSGGRGGKRNVARRMATQPSATTTAAAAAVTVAVGRAKPRRLSRALAIAAAVTSTVSTVLFLIAVVTGAWESVTFDFAAVNASLGASAAAQRVGQKVERLMTSSGQTAGLVLLPTEATATVVPISSRSTPPTISAAMPAVCLLDMRGGLWSSPVEQNLKFVISTIVCSKSSCKKLITFAGRSIFELNTACETLSNQDRLRLNPLPNLTFMLFGFTTLSMAEGGLFVYILRTGVLPMKYLSSARMKTDLSPGVM